MMNLLYSFAVLSVFLATMSVRAEEDELIRPYVKQIYRAGKTQREIASELNISPSLVSKYLSGAVLSSPTIIRNFRQNFKEQFFSLYVQKKLKKERDGLPSILIIKPSFMKQQDAKAPVLMPPIAIAHRIEGKGKAAFYDHQMMRSATGMMTVSVYAAHHERGDLEVYARQLPFHMHLSNELPESLSGIQEDGEQKLMQPLPNAGLLVIAGRASKYETHQAQNHFEQELIRQAMVRGQPILAICAGCWQLWQHDSKREEIPKGGRIKTVKGHAYSKMVYMSEQHGRAVNNTQIHGVRIIEDSLLKRILPQGTQELRVNSLHSYAPDEVFIPDFFQVSGVSVDDKGLTPANRGGVMGVDQNTIEAFETKHGAPTMGIQWHPEAYNKDQNTKGVVDAEKHRTIIQYLAQAGIAYSHKRRVLDQLEGIFSRL